MALVIGWVTMSLGALWALGRLSHWTAAQCLGAFDDWNLVLRTMRLRDAEAEARKVKVMDDSD